MEHLTAKTDRELVCEAVYTGDRCVRLSSVNGRCRLVRIPCDLIRGAAAGIPDPGDRAIFVMIGRRWDGNLRMFVGSSTNGIEGMSARYDIDNQYLEDCYFLSCKDEVLDDGRMADLIRRFRVIAGECGLDDGALPVKEHHADSVEALPDPLMDEALEMFGIMGVDFQGMRNCVSYHMDHSKKNHHPISACIKLTVVQSRLAERLLGIMRDIDPGCYPNGNKAYVAICSPIQTVVYLVPRYGDSFRAYLHGDMDDFDDPERFLERYDGTTYGRCRVFCDISDYTDMALLSRFFRQSLMLVNSLKK